jgi:hypothetical protein
MIYSRFLCHLQTGRLSFLLTFLLTSSQCLYRYDLLTQWPWDVLVDTCLDALLRIRPQLSTVTLAVWLNNSH